MTVTRLLRARRNLTFYRQIFPQNWFREQRREANWLRILRQTWTHQCWWLVRRGLFEFVLLLLFLTLSRQHRKSGAEWNGAHSSWQHVRIPGSTSCHSHTRVQEEMKETMFFFLGFFFGCVCLRMHLKQGHFRVCLKQPKSRVIEFQKSLADTCLARVECADISWWTQK